MEKQQVKEFEGAFGHTKGEPGYNLLLAEYIKFRKENPSGGIDHLPMVKLFSGIDWHDGEEVQRMAKINLDTQKELWNRFDATANQPINQRIDFLLGLIKDLATYRSIAMMLEAKLFAERQVFRK